VGECEIERSKRARTPGQKKPAIFCALSLRASSKVLQRQRMRKGVIRIRRAVGRGIGCRKAKQFAGEGSKRAWLRRSPREDCPRHNKGAIDAEVGADVKRRRPGGVDE
jgi:hypothetical protein